MKTILCYTKDEKGRYVSANHAFLNCIGASSISELLGLTDHDISWGDPVIKLKENDRATLEAGRIQIFFEHCIFNGTKQLFKSIKMPLLDPATEQVVIHGISIPVSDACLIYLSHQQASCLQHFALGFTHKQIAELLNISQKTVEHYLDAVKLKLGLKTRFELVEHAVERGLISTL